MARSILEKPKRDGSRRRFTLPTGLLIVAGVVLFGGYFMASPSPQRYTGVTVFERTAEFNVYDVTPAAQFINDPFPLSATALIKSATYEMIVLTLTAEAERTREATPNGIFITFTPDPRHSTQIQIPLALVINADNLSLQAGNSLDIIASIDASLAFAVSGAMVVAMDEGAVTLDVSAEEAITIASLIAEQTTMFLASSE